MLFGKQAFLEPAIFFVSLSPFLDQKGEAKVYALCFHFFPTQSLLTLLGISLHVQTKQPLSMFFLFPYPLRLHQKPPAKFLERSFFQRSIQDPSHEGKKRHTPGIHSA